MTGEIKCSFKLASLLVIFSISFDSCYGQFLDNLLDVQYNSFIQRTKSGHLWVSSAGGWNCLNGKETIHFDFSKRKNVKGGTIQSDIFEDAVENLWFTTYQSLVKYDPVDDLFQSQQLFFEGDSIKSDYHLFYFAQKSRELFITAGEKICIYNTEDNTYSFLPFLTKGKRFIVSERDTNEAQQIMALPWANGPGIEVYTRNDKSWKRDAVFNRFDIFCKENGLLVTSGLTFTDGFVLGTNKGVYRLSVNGEFKAIHGTKSLLINHMSSYSKDTVLVSAKDKGVFLISLNEDSPSEKLFFPELDRENLTPFEIFVDFNKDVYFSIRHKGVLKTKISSEMTCEEFSQGINSLFYLGGGEFVIVDANQEYFWTRDIQHGPNSSSISIANSGSLIDAIKVGNKFLLASLEGICWYDDDFNLLGCSDLDDGQIIQVSLVDSNKIDALTTLGNYELSFQSDNLIMSSEFRICYNELISSVFTLSDELVVASINDTEVRVCTKDSILNFQLSGRLTDVTYDKKRDVVYIATRNGLFAVDSNLSFYRILEEEWQLGTSYIYKLWLDADSLLWITSDKYFGYYNLNTNVFYALKSSENIHNAESFCFSNSNLIYQSSETQLCSTPLSSYMGKDSVLHEIGISEIKVDEIDVELATSWDEDIEIPYGFESLQFNLTLSTSSDLSDVFFRVEGYDRDWILVEDNEVNLVSMVPGEYYLLVSPVFGNREHLNIKTLQITILPPYHQTWWFRSLAASALIGLGFGANSVNTRRKLREQERELEKQKLLREQREQMSRDLHDEMGGGLTKIKHIVEKGKYGQGDSSIQHIGDLASDLMGNMRDLLWSLDETNDEFGRLAARVRVAVAGYCKGTGLSFVVKVQKPMPMVSISGLVRRNILLILKEAFTNTLKHSNASSVIVNMEIKEDHLLISYKDDGSGEKFRVKAVDKQNGLINMKRRAEQAGGSLTFELDESGSELILDIPV